MISITKLSGSSSAFELEVKKWECQAPKGTFAVEITGIQKNAQLEETMRSTYQFFMTQEQLEELAKALIK